MAVLLTLILNEILVPKLLAIASIRGDSVFCGGKRAVGPLFLDCPQVIPWRFSAWAGIFGCRQPNFVPFMQQK